MADEKLVKKTLQQYNCDVVMHFSALSLVGESMENPLLYYENNVAKGIALVKAMLSAGVNKLIFSSTAAVYGNPEKVPIEEDEPTQPINTYGRTKLQFEQFLADCSQAEELNYISLRYFNAAGASENFGEDHRPETHLIPIVLQTALGNREAVTVFGDDYPTPDGTCIRDYIHVVDLADAHLRAMAHLRRQDKCAKIFNLGNNKGYSVLEIIKVAGEVTGKKINYKIGTRRPGDPPVLIASNHKIMKELGWRLRYPEIHQIVESAWRWLLKHPDGYPE